MKFYSNHLKDPFYIDFQNDVVKGKICEWRTQVTEFLKDLKEEPLLSEAAVRKQISFAKCDVLIVLNSLCQHNAAYHLTILLMNKKIILKATTTKIST
jgi:hypothetical protein